LPKERRLASKDDIKILHLLLKRAVAERVTQLRAYQYCELKYDKAH
jgi:hypothetical protein